MADRFVSQVCRAFAGLRPPARVLLAVSGGADSVALLDVLNAGKKRRDLRGVELCVGHFDHRLRPDSGRDLQLVARLAEERGLTFISRVAGELPREGGLEQSARKARYRALQEMAHELHCGAVVTAHTATDQAETLLWRLVRGAGSRGLGGMRARRKLGTLHLLRPLLDVTREETRAWCARRALSFHDDPTNENERPRARLRAEVLPVLERLAPGAVTRLAAAAQRLQADEKVLDALARSQEEADVQQFARLPSAVRRRVLVRWVVRELGNRRRLTATHIEALEQLVLSGRGEVDLPASQGERRVALVIHNRLTLRRVATPDSGSRFGSPRA